MQTQYRPDESGLCNICLLKLAGPRSLTYGCYTCNIHLHSACARYFRETISFFAHPAHDLRLRRSPGRVCDICRGDCPVGSFVYSCTVCGFDVHPLCSMLPERFASPQGPSHEPMRMFSSESPAGSCSACHHPLPRWHYIGGSSLKLHIACAIDTPTGVGHQRPPAVVYGAAGSYGGAAVVQQGSHGAVSQRSFFGAPVGFYNPGIQGYGYGHAGNYYYGPAMPNGSGGYCSSGCGQQTSLMGLIAGFLMRTAINELLSDLFSELL